MRYDAFISYSHAADGLLAPALQSALHRLARPWYRLRALHVFRDQTNLSAAPDLWPVIESALGESRALILLASPEAAASKWVRREIEAWRAKPDPGPIYIVLTHGALTWDGGNFRGAAPDALAGHFEGEPLWVDLAWAHGERDLSLKNPRFADAAATLAAALHGLDKDTIIGEDIRQHRRTRTIAGAAIAMLTVLFIAAVAAAIVARRQLVRARENLAETLATNALTGHESRDTALLMAVAATRLAATPSTRAALLRNVQRNRHVITTIYPEDALINLQSVAVDERGRVAKSEYSHGWLVSAHGRFVTVHRGDESGICQPDPLSASQFAGARDSDAIACFAETFVTACTPACRSVELPATPQAIALTDDGTFLAVALPDELEGSTLHLLRTQDLVATHVLANLGRIVAIAGDGDKFRVLFADGVEEQVSIDGTRSEPIAASISVPPPHFSMGSSIGTADGLRFIAVTDRLEGLGMRDVDPAITLLARSTPNGRLSHLGGAMTIAPPPSRFVVRDRVLYEGSKRRSAIADELPPWADSDDHEVEVFAVSADGSTIVTASNLRGEGVSPRIVLRNGDAVPLLLASDFTFEALAAGTDFIAAAGENRIQLWNRRTGAIASDVLVASGEVTGLAFTNDDATLLVAYKDKRSETIDLSLAALQRLACESANRDLSQDEWRERLSALTYETPCTNILGRKLSKRW